MLRTTTLMLLAAIVTAPAAAQPAPEAGHKQSIGGGAHWALPYSGRPGEKPGVQASWQRWLSPHMGIGSDFRWWGRNVTREINSPAQVGPGGIPIRAQQGRENQRISSYGFGVGALARGTSGRLSLIGGAGPAFFVDRTSHDTRINDSRNAGTIRVRTIGVHMLAEVEVRATSRLSLFAGLRMEVRDLRDVESSSAYPTAGVRFAF